MAINNAMISTLIPSKQVEEKEGIDSILYGDPKTGKTTTLDDPTMKVLLLDLEGGSSVLAGSPNVDIVPITSLEQLNAAGELIKNLQWVSPEGKIIPYSYGLVAIDSITRLQDLVKKFIVETYAPNRRREIATKFGAQTDWGDFGIIISDLVKYFHGLTKRGSKSINVMWIAHKDNKYENPNVETLVTGTQIKMQGGSVPIVMSTVDAIFYMSKGIIENKQTKEKNLYYWIQTETMGVTEAGVRQSKREEKLPQRIYNPVWSEIFTKLGYKTEAPKQK